MNQARDYAEMLRIYLITVFSIFIDDENPIKILLVSEVTTCMQVSEGWGVF